MNKKTKKLIVSILILIVAFIYTTYEDDINNYLDSISNTKTEQKRKIDKKITPVIKEDELDVYFIDVGQADSILIRNKGHNMLIDAGNNEDGSKLVTYFKSLGIESFDYVVGTHAHEDHIGGMDDIIKNFNINKFYMPDAITTTKTFEDVLDALELKGIGFNTPEIDSEFSFSDSKIKTLYVGSDKSDLNDTSIVLKLTYGSNSFLFTGDATSGVEKQILNKDLSSDVLKVGHHGSSYSSSAQFLRKVNPKYAVISVGVNNTYRHPNQITLDKLEKIGSKIYRTDKDSTILMKSDGVNIKVEKISTDTNG